MTTNQNQNPPVNPDRPPTLGVPPGDTSTPPLLPDTSPAAQTSQTSLLTDVAAPTATVTLKSSDTARADRHVSEQKSFFVTGTLRKLEDRGEGDGRMTLITSSGQFAIPSMPDRFMTRAAELYSKNRVVIFAIAGTGEFDGAGRLRQLEHLTDMQRVDRAFNPDRRLTELREVLEDPTRFDTRLGRARTALEHVVMNTGRSPGLFLSEDDELEARWILTAGPDTPARVISTTFGDAIETYVFDRATREVTVTDTISRDEDILPGLRIAEIVRHSEDSSDD